MYLYIAKICKGEVIISREMQLLKLGSKVFSMIDGSYIDPLQRKHRNDA